MNYIYDITLNFDKKLYEFYEWKSEDFPEFILKIPVFKVDDETFYDLKNNNIIVSKEFLNKIINKTEAYSPNSLKIIKYSALFVTEETSIAIEFDEYGNIFMKSNLSLDEEEDVLEVTKMDKYTIIDYEIISKNDLTKEFYTREEISLSSLLENDINKIYKNNEEEKLKYLFYEVFDTKLNDINKIYFKLLHIINKKDIKMYKIKEILDIMNKKIVNENS